MAVLDNVGRVVGHTELAREHSGGTIEERKQRPEELPMA